jgi:hypothetical protein
VGGARGAAVSGPWGAAAGGWRGGAVGHATRYVSPGVVRSNAGYVRRGFGYNCFTRGWYGVHTGAWVAPRWRVANFWVAPAWATVAAYCGIAAAPIVYDYGSSVVIEDNTVYSNGDPLASAEEYATQAISYADRGRRATGEDEEWQPLGVFGLIQGEEETTSNVFQLAVNAAGIIRGNYYDAIADNNLPVYGSVDRTTQRAAWSVGEKKNVVFEAGLNNLTQGEAPVLVHFGKERSQQMYLVRLEEPQENP